MTLYSLVLFAHIVAVLVLFTALSFEALTLSHVRRASTLAETRRWIDPIPRFPVTIVGSVLVVFSSGAYMAMRMEAGALAWPRVAVMAMLLILPLGAVTARRMRAIHHICASGTVSQSELVGRLQDPFLTISLGIRISVVLGIVLLMTAKPELWEALAIVGASALIGLATAALVPRRGAGLSTADRDPRN